jgi:hypothetical protein
MIFTGESKHQSKGTCKKQVCVRSPIILGGIKILRRISRTRAVQWFKKCPDFTLKQREILYAKDFNPLSPKMIAGRSQNTFYKSTTKQVMHQIKNHALS